MVPDASRFESVFDLAAAWPLIGVPHAAVANRVLRVTDSRASCVLPEQLALKYGQHLSEQRVISFTNTVTLDQAWFNKVRASKPQTFRPADQPAVKEGVSAGACDFCRWQDYTAADVFGRIETEHVVTASNLFKYVPAHGLVLFKHHDPLQFNEVQLGEMLAVAAQWFEAAASTAGAAYEWPLFLWNCLARAGASQFHGHSQLALSEVPFPADLAMIDAAAQYTSGNAGASYHEDIRRVYDAAGLLSQHGGAHDRAWIFPSLTPCKDAEIVVHGQRLDSPAFAAALHAALRAIIDDLQFPCFNVAIQPCWEAATLEAQAAATSQPFSHCRVVARVVSRGRPNNRASDFGGLEVFAGASIGHTDPYAVRKALSARLQMLNQAGDA